MNSKFYEFYLLFNSDVVNFVLKTDGVVSLRDPRGGKIFFIFFFYLFIYLFIFFSVTNLFFSICIILV